MDWLSFFYGAATALFYCAVIASICRAVRKPHGDF